MGSCLEQLGFRVHFGLFTKKREREKKEREGNNKDEKKLGNGTFLTCANVNKKMGAY